MITLRLVHSIPPEFQPVFGGVAAGIGTIQGTLTLGLPFAGTAPGVGSIVGSPDRRLQGTVAGVGSVTGGLAGTLPFSGTVAGVGSVTVDIAAYLPSLVFSDARNSQYIALLEDI